MTSKTLKSAIWLALAASAVAFAAGGPPDGQGNKPTTEATNSLSVPAILTGLGDFKLTCGSNAFLPLAGPTNSTGGVAVPVYYPDDCATSKDGTQVCVDEGFYYVQGDALWQAPCNLVTSTQASAKWGDNIAGDASLKVGSPIRIELTLFDAAGLAANQQGYLVIKLQPDELDRASDYGHLAEGAGTAGDPFAAIPYTVGDVIPGGTFPAIVHDPAATLKIERIVGGVPQIPAVYDGEAGGEINATGKIVYGYSLRVAEAGTYRITYTMTNVNIDGCPTNSTCTLNSVSKDIEILPGGGRRPR